MNAKFILNIWQLNEASQFMTEVPYFSQSFEIDHKEYTDPKDVTIVDQWERAGAIESRITPLVHNNRPIVDCAGWVAEVLDEQGKELFRGDNYYFND